jgi:hypothetical protein
MWYNTLFGSNNLPLIFVVIPSQIDKYGALS